MSIGWQIELPRQKIDGQEAAAIGRKLGQAFEVSVDAKKQIKVFRCQSELSGDDLRTRFAISGRIRVRKLTRIIQRIADLQFPKGLVLSKMAVARMRFKLLRVEFERTERGLNKVETRVGRWSMPLLTRRRHGRHNTTTTAKVAIPREHTMCSGISLCAKEGETNCRACKTFVSAVWVRHLLRTPGIRSL